MRPSIQRGISPVESFGGLACSVLLSAQYRSDSPKRSHWRDWRSVGDRGTGGGILDIGRFVRVGLSGSPVSPVSVSWLEGDSPGNVEEPGDPPSSRFRLYPAW